MIVSKTPLRMSFVGGGTDLPAFYIENEGAVLSTAINANFFREMSAGRGYLALAALIFGKWKPKTALLACLLFVFTDALQIRLQGVPIPGIGVIPVQFIQAIPYVLTVVLLRIIHCWIIVSMFVQVQYKINPEANGASITQRNKGKKANIFFCIGSVIGLGLRRCCKYIVAPINTGNSPISKKDGTL